MCTHCSKKAHNKSINGDREKRVALFQTLELLKNKKGSYVFISNSKQRFK